MKTFAIGDIHGCFRAFDAVVAAADLAEGDTLVLLGDYVDRGPDTPRVLDRIIRESGNRNLVSLRGNHEVMMLESRENHEMFDGWQLCGGRETLESYGWSGDGDWSQLISEEHWAFLEQTRAWLETDDYIFVHANVCPYMGMEEHSDMQLYWDKCHDLKLHRSGRRAVIGHTRQRTGVPRQWPGGVCIDTAAVGGQWLTCLEVESGEFTQANQAGEVREGHLVGW